jgi:hypothetical protein
LGLTETHNSPLGTKEVMPRSAEEYVALLGLDDDDVEDVGDEMQTSQAAWTSASIPNNAIDLGNASEGALLERLFKNVKM